MQLIILLHLFFFVLFTRMACKSLLECQECRMIFSPKEKKKSYFFKNFIVSLNKFACTTFFSPLLFCLLIETLNGNRSTIILIDTFHCNKFIFRLHFIYASHYCYYICKRQSIAKPTNRYTHILLCDDQNYQLALYNGFNFCVRSLRIMSYCVQISFGVL